MKSLVGTDGRSAMVYALVKQLGGSPSSAPDTLAAGLEYAQFVVHPVIHGEDKLSDRVGKSGDFEYGQFGGEILEAGNGIGISAFAAQRFNEGVNIGFGRRLAAKRFSSRVLR